eukprot:TRINITY_DN24261_c0_g1_i1.p1 TRINITY_DN24261_c0_g1~~TRINITY_DN24261_c0_g1_i1.p1  ORF type:complete len:371 (+),score=78.94 TRINITY_DN24261_c0_g1_i1:73-1113(+)
MASRVAEISSEHELVGLRSNHHGLSLLLLWAPWHPPSVHLAKVVEALASEHRTVRCGKLNVDVCPAMATRLGADQVPFVAFFDSHGSVLDVLRGADAPQLVAKTKAWAERPFQRPGSGGSAASASAGVDADVSAADDLNSRLKALINFSPVMLFMKGSQAQPFCKFSKQAVALLEKYEAEFSTFDILQHEDVRQGLKELSNWKTYPQLYIKGELIGGVDIMKEMDEDGSLAEACKASDEDDIEVVPLQDRLRSLVHMEPIMLFMKGVPEAPRCGFSRKTVTLLQEHGVKFGHFDILSDESVRQGLKEYANWPTYPQVYAAGKLIGGIDILKELEDEGALLEELGMA